MRIATVLAVALLGTTSLAGAQQARAAIQHYQLNIPRQPLDTALKDLAQQTGLQIGRFSGRIDGSAMVGPVKGDQTPEQALKILLIKTGLDYKIVSDTTIAVYNPKDATVSALEERDGTRDSVKGQDSSGDRLPLAQAPQGSTSSTPAVGSSYGLSPQPSALSPKLAQANTVPTGLEGKKQQEQPKLEEIVVTARRREENIQTVPIAITVVSQQKLQDNNVQTLGDLQYLVPSMDASTQLTRDALSVSIRGQGPSGVSSLPGVVAYLNEVPIPTDTDGNLAGGPGLLFDLENVQVLKGPQGTLFGRNTMGGALLLQTARPKNELGGSIQLGYGNYNDREIDGNINIPIVNDVLLARIAFNGQLRDGFTRILSDPGHPNSIDADNRDYGSVRGTMTFRPGDQFQNDTIYTYSKYASHGSPLLLTACNPAGGFATQFYPSFAALCQQQLQLGARTSLPLDTRSDSGGVNLSLDNISRFVLSDWLTFRNIFGYAEAKQALALDIDGTALPFLGEPSPARHATHTQYTEEAQLLGQTLAGRFNWIVGAFYLRDREAPTIWSLTFAGTSYTVLESGSDTSKAVYMQGTYDLSALASGLKFTAGARYTKDYRSSNSVNSFPCSGPCPPTNETRSNAVTWTFGLDYQVAPDTLLYLTSRRGYRAGGFNFDQVGNPLPGFGPEYVKDIELGTKSDWNAGNIKFRTNADVFYQDYRDIAVTQTLNSAQGTTFLTGNAAAARLWGAEIEASARLTPHLEFGVNFSKLDFKYTDFGPGVDANSLTAGRDGGRIPYKYGLYGSYQLPLNPQLGNLSARADWNWQGGYGDFTMQGGSIPAFGVLNLAVNWEGLGGKPIDISLFASNVLDKLYSVGGVAFYNSYGYSMTRFGEPRMYGLRFRYKFGGEAMN